MRALRVGLGLAAALALQSQVTATLVARGWTLDLVAVVVLYFGLTRGPLVGLFSGTLGGIGQDALSGGVLGVGGLVKTLIGFGAGVIGAQFLMTGVVARFVVFFGGTLLDVLGFRGLSAALGVHDLAVSSGMLLRHGLTNALVGVLLFQTLELVPSVVGQRRPGSRLR